MKTMPGKLNEQLLEEYLSNLITKILEKLQKNNPGVKLSNISPEQKNKLVQHLTKIAMQNCDFRKEIEKEAVIGNNPEFERKMLLAIVMTSKLGNQEKFLEELTLLFKSKGIKELDLKNEQALLMKLQLTPIQKNQFIVLQQTIRDMFKDMEKLNLIKPPTPSPSKGGQKLELDPNAYLLGIDPKSGASILVTYIEGNKANITDVNPYNDLTAIGQIHKLFSPEGDPQGFRHEARDALLSEAVADVTAELTRPTLTNKHQ